MAKRTGKKAGQRSVKQYEGLLAESQATNKALLESLSVLTSRITGPALVPQAAPIVTPSRSGPRKLYSKVTNPVPPFGDTAMTVWTYLGKHGESSQKDLESGTKLTEGQIKGAIRQLALAGYVATTKANGE